MSVWTVAVSSALWAVPVVWWALRPYPPEDFPARLGGAVIVGLTASVILFAWVHVV
jgi:hypothetical protein